MNYLHTLVLTASVSATIAVHLADEFCRTSSIFSKASATSFLKPKQDRKWLFTVTEKVAH